MGPVEHWKMHFSQAAGKSALHISNTVMLQEVSLQLVSSRRCPQLQLRFQKRKENITLHPYLNPQMAPDRITR